MEEIYTEETTPQKMSLLEKINKERSDLKDKKHYNEINLLFVKTSSDDMVISYTNKLLADVDKSGNMSGSANPGRNIGLKKIIKYIENEKSGSVLKINLFDYNYILSKKFRYMKNQAILFADHYIFVINIYDSRSIDNFKAQYDEIKKLKKNNTSIFFAIVLKFCQNFLLKLGENQVLNDLKLETYFKNTIEVENDTKLDFNTVVEKLLNIT